MRTKTISIRLLESLHSPWGAGIGGGLVGGVAMGVILHAGSNMMPLIGALYGWPTVIGGWIAHLLNSIVIGLLFALIISFSIFQEETETVIDCIVLGLIYGVTVGLVTSGIMLPIAMNAIGTQSLPEPIFPLPGFIGGILVVISVGIAHLVYGILLGAVYGIIHTTPRAGADTSG